MSLKKIYSLSEAEEQDQTGRAPEGSPPTLPSQPQPQQGSLSRLFGGNTQQQPQQAGAGPLSNGVPTPVAGGSDKPPQNGPSAQAPGQTVGTQAASQTIPYPRNNVGGTGSPPPGGVPVVKAPNAPANDDENTPLPDLPIEGVSISRAFGLRHEFSVPRRAGKLIELYNIDEMPRPAGSYGRAAMGMLKWAQDQQGKEFTKRELFDAYVKAGGQAGQLDKNKAYQSFSTVMQKFVDPRGRGTPDQPLVVVQQGIQGSRKSVTILRWGNVRPSQSAAAKPMPGATPYDDMELGPAGSADQGPAAAAQAEPEQGAQAEPGVEPEQEPEQLSGEELDWIPEADPETGVGRAMIALNDADPEKLQELLANVHGAETVMAAAQEAIRLYGRGSAMSSNAIKVAKSAAANLGLPDPDNLL